MAPPPALEQAYTAQSGGLSALDQAFSTQAGAGLIAIELNSGTIAHQSPSFQDLQGTPVHRLGQRSPYTEKHLSLCTKHLSLFTPTYPLPHNA